jgi:phage repressor protein C with HTH and peptisase S24 domain
VEKNLPIRELRYRAAPVIAAVAISMEEASRAQCATILDLAVAAGTGRELWDEPCEEWLELPGDISPSPRYLAVRVSGDSMSPVLEKSDVILIKLDALPEIDDLVVAKIPDEGYVVKRFAGTKIGRVELASFNPAYDILAIPRDRLTLLGTVIARFRHE